MPDLSSPAGARLRALDRLTSDTRALLRRVARVQSQTAELEDSVLSQQGRELVDTTERLLTSLEERRQVERRAARRQLRGIPVETEQP